MNSETYRHLNEILDHLVSIKQPFNNTLRDEGMS